MSAYSDLTSIMSRIACIEEAIGYLEWDADTMMPRLGARQRAEQIGTLKSVQLALLTHKDLDELIERASGERLSAWQHANLALIRHRATHLSGVPPEIASKQASLSSLCRSAWRQAKAKGDFRVILPHFSPLVANTRHIARIKGDRLGCGPYQALMDAYEPGLSVDVVDALFADLEPFLREAVALSPRGGLCPTASSFSQDKQLVLFRDVMASLGFAWSRGRLDCAPHPFCAGTSKDVRPTTRCDRRDFMAGLLYTLHETGHAFYIQGLPRAWARQPVGGAPSAAFHEALALIFDTYIGRSDSFIRWLAPLASGVFDTAIAPETLACRYRRIFPSELRLGSDEVTYMLHIILRYKLERQLIENSLEAADIPAAWSEMLRNMFGLSATDDSRGCLQDIHWYAGSFGYFPTYGLGAVISAQIFSRLLSDLPGVQSDIEIGEFTGLRSWLLRHVYTHGARYSTPDLVKRISGDALSAAFYKHHIAMRYVSVR